MYKKKIFKYKIPLTKWTQYELPKGTKIINVAEQDEELYFWAIVNPDAKIEERKIYVFGTGQEIDDMFGIMEYIGTVHMKEGLVWHIFAERPISRTNEEVTKTEDAIELYLKDTMKRHPEWDLRTHAEEIALRVWQVQDEF